MKRFATILLVLVLGTGALPAAAEPAVFAESYQLAEADWVVMDGPSHATYYFAAAVHSVSPQGVITYGVVGSGDCDIERGRNWMMIICQGSGRGKELALDQFEFDPALRSASLDMRSKGVRNVANWRGRGTLPHNGGGVYSGDGYAGADAMLARVARVDARILGHQMPKGGSFMNFAFLSQGASAAAFDEFRGRHVTINPDGSYEYEVKFRIPR